MIRILVITCASIFGCFCFIILVFLFKLLIDIIRGKDKWFQNWIDKN